jgi:hypothetical protein
MSSSVETFSPLFVHIVFIFSLRLVLGGDDFVSLSCWAFGLDAASPEDSGRVSLPSGGSASAIAALNLESRHYCGLREDDDDSLIYIERKETDIGELASRAS